MLYKYLVLLSLSVGMCWSRLDETEVRSACSNLQDCHYLDQSLCPKSNDDCKCRIVDDHCRKAMICCNIVGKVEEELNCALQLYNITRMNVGALHIRNISIPVLDVDKFKSWRRLNSLMITDGNISTIVNSFAYKSPIMCLNLSSNAINKFKDKRALVNLFNISTLDLSNNNLSEIPNFKKESSFDLDISGNNRVICTNISEILSSGNLNFLNKKATRCQLNWNYDWFGSNYSIPFTTVENHHIAKKDCITNCSCESERILVINQEVHFGIKVNCSNAHLESLPSPLPLITVSLNISNNKISSLEGMGNDTSYETLQNLYADNNQIDSLLPLEGTKFITNFRQLSLKNNSIRTIPTYIFFNVFDRNDAERQVLLGGNKFRCDCDTAKTLSEWLKTKHASIPDGEQLECENLEATRVVRLEAAKLCQGPTDWSDYIYYIIAAELLMLVLLVTKVSYDYWVFKTAGYLPWPANKMPKLPCDWLCE